ncbi:hypothetical protein DL765_006793 [Monosporascus sp. GIB2]|nr:hypothetical protein DL765_006793 [Monosporascus sp. GIB2]
MDAGASIGLASSLVQLISFTGTLVSKSREIYRSADGILVENDELSTVIKTLEAQNRRIAAQATAFQSSSSETAKHLLQLQQVDSVLLEVLQDRLKDFTETAKDKNAKIEQNFSQILLSLQPGSQWQRQLIETARQAVQAQTPPSVTQLDDFSALLSAGVKHDREKLLKLRMLESLNFADMRDRYERIPEAHQKTFEWVFREPACNDDLRGKWDNFATWLMSNKQLYWVTGKPGSGKSTLMKYLSDDTRLRSHLDVWRGERHLYTGRFFFWNSGAALQMSRVGLLQSLLHETVSQFPDEIPRIFPDRWQYQEYFGYDGRPWSWSEVSGSFKKLVADSTKAFFFMIDGLDELDGDCAELADFLLKTASTGENVKLCLASRPWLVFEDAFRYRPSLRMEDLTARDIEVFASDKLTENVMFAQLQKDDPMNARALIKEVTEKSSGVFLWVSLVVKSLLEGLQDDDTVDDLLARLQFIPRDLEALYQKILGDLDPGYFEQASQIFQTVRASYLPTVKDFLEDRAHIFLVSDLKSSFDPHVTLCAARLRHAKAICPKEDIGDMSSMEVFADLLRQFVIQCHWMERRDKPEYVPFLDEMDKVTETILGAGEQNAFQDLDIPHWTKRVDPYVGRTCQVHSLFDYAVIRSLTHYVQAKITDGYSFAMNPNKSYLLRCATETNQRMADLLDPGDRNSFLAQSTTLYAGSVEETQAPFPATKSSNEPVKEQRKWRHNIMNSLRKRLSSRKS